MQHLEFSGAVRPLKWSLGVKWLKPGSQITARQDIETLNTPSDKTAITLNSPCVHF